MILAKDFKHVLQYGWVHADDLEANDTEIGILVDKHIYYIPYEGVFTRNVNAEIDMCLGLTTDVVDEGHTAYDEDYFRRVCKKQRILWSAMSNAQKRIASDELFANTTGVNEWYLRNHFGKNIDITALLANAKYSHVCSKQKITYNGFAVLLAPKLNIKNIKGLSAC